MGLAMPLVLMPKLRCGYILVKTSSFLETRIVFRPTKTSYHEAVRAGAHVPVH
jgi:hypothetical protein